MEVNHYTNETVSWLVTTPASDLNFKMNLRRATAEDIREALAAIEGKKETKTKKKALLAALQRKTKEA